MRKVLLFTLIVLIAITFAFAGTAQSSNDVKLKSTVKDNSGVETPQGGTAIGFVEGDGEGEEEGTTGDKNPKGILYISYMDESETAFNALEDAPVSGLICDLTGNDTGFDRVKFVFRFAGNVSRAHEYVLTLSCADGFKSANSENVIPVTISGLSDVGSSLPAGITVNDNTINIAAGTKALQAATVASSYATWTQSEEYAAGDYTATITVACSAK